MDQSESIFEEEKWRKDMIIRINKATDAMDDDTRLFMDISKPSKALVDVKPQSYSP